MHKKSLTEVEAVHFFIEGFESQVAGFVLLKVSHFGVDLSIFAFEIPQFGEVVHQLDVDGWVEVEVQRKHYSGLHFEKLVQLEQLQVDAGQLTLSLYLFGGYYQCPQC